MRKNQIAAQGYTIRDLCRTPESTDITFGRIKAAGYDAIQISAFWQVGVDTLAELAKKHELEVCATHISFQEMADDLPLVIENHKKLGCTYVGIGGMPLEARESPSGLPRVREEVQRGRPAAPGCRPDRHLPQPQLRIRLLRPGGPDRYPL